MEDDKPPTTISIRRYKWRRSLGDLSQLYEDDSSKVYTFAVLPQEKTRSVLDSDGDTDWTSTIDVSSATTGMRTSASVETTKNNDDDMTAPGGSATYGGSTLTRATEVDKSDVTSCSVALANGSGFSTDDQNNNRPEGMTNKTFCHASADTASKVDRRQLTSTCNLAFSSGITAGCEEPKTEPGNKRSGGQIDNSITAATVSRGADQVLIVEVEKDSTGVGFSIEGGKQSLDGDRPIVIKRLFSGKLSILNTVSHALHYRLWHVTLV